MNTLFKSIVTYIRIFAKWVLIAGITGLLGGIIGSVFHLALDMATHFRTEHNIMVLMLPLAGILIAALYHPFRSKGKIDTNRVIEAVQTENTVPLIMTPLIFLSTVITQLFGGSAGREGAALQLGGSIGYNFGKLLRLSSRDLHLIVMAGMSSVFAALFGTPVTAAVFALEVICVGTLHYSGILPCIIASVVAFLTAQAFGISPIRFDVLFPALEYGLLIKIIVLSLLCAVVSIIFCNSISMGEKYTKKLIKNTYARAFVCASVITGLTFLLKTYDYNGAGMEIVAKAMKGDAKPAAFLLKMIFTVITLSAGFKGGEIVPTLFVGSTFGCVVGGLLGLDPAFGAAVGFVALFCGVVNCPIASLLLGIEVFGTDSTLVFAVVCAVSFMMSGYSGLYKSQKFAYSKLYDEDYE